MNDIFISYRRQDSAGYAGRLRDNLATRYGEDRVFLDITDLEPGRSFVELLHQAVDACKCVLVVIGPEWATGRRRLDDPGDFVRAEIAAALRARKVVVPVLVGGATMPSLAELPEEIRDIAMRQAGVLHDASWDRDLLSFYQILDPLLSIAPRRPEVTPLPSSPAAPARRSFLARLAIAFDVLMDRGYRCTEELVPVLMAPIQRTTSVASASAEVFVSHAEEDREIADRIVRLLEGRGHPCWIAHRDIAAGIPSWSSAIVSAIANSSVIVLVVTVKSMSSKQVLREITIADDENIPILPLRFDNAAFSDDFKYFFATTQRLEIANLPWTQAMPIIDEAVQQRLSDRQYSRGTS